ncbi:hypothetical protein HYFRA_00011015 [Hymenoscyphus fraxineus]|uniref:Uncharacterized protein n=1 Tax=Hymenoscyphus fraxineus TaxID=746836 RepID=A0A9N9PLG1_9HELO|nr:hypothetical protein HYFRA_00011015 [Hymenoscyphus fraxineus]
MKLTEFYVDGIDKEDCLSFMYNIAIVKISDRETDQVPNFLVVAIISIFEYKLEQCRGHSIPNCQEGARNDSSITPQCNAITDPKSKSVTDNYHITSTYSRDSIHVFCTLTQVSRLVWNLGNHSSNDMRESYAEE